jgi:hypothetical protein
MGSGGSDDPPGSQGSSTLSEDYTLLFAVNAGSGETSVFEGRGSDLLLVDKTLCVVAASQSQGPAQTSHIRPKQWRQRSVIPLTAAASQPLPAPPNPQPTHFFPPLFCFLFGFDSLA